MSWGPGWEGQALVLSCRELTGPTPALHPNSTGLGARGPLVPRTPDALRALALLRGCLNRVSRQHLCGQKGQTKLEGFSRNCAEYPLQCLRARAVVTGLRAHSVAQVRLDVIWQRVSELGGGIPILCHLSAPDWLQLIHFLKEIVMCLLTFMSPPLTCEWFGFFSCL